MNQVLRNQHLVAAVKLLGDILTGRTPADRVLEQHFRANRNMGSRDRGFVAELIYACLRSRRMLEAWGGVEAQQPLQERLQRMVVAYLLKECGWSARAIADAQFAPDVFSWADAMRQRSVEDFPLAVRLNLPDEWVEMLIAQYGEQETIELTRALNLPAPVDLRVNTHKATREEVKHALMQAGFECGETPFSPVGLRREKRGAMFNTDAFRNGMFELQDEGSQLLSYAVEPKRRQRVVDFCAGGGGKTLHLAALMENTGDVIAMDINERRLRQLKPRYVRAGLDNIRVVTWQQEIADTLRERWGNADRVLVDAPCSGTGTLRRNPDIKWRELDVKRLANTQREILEQAATLVKTGGKLIYSTCSVLRAENTDVIHAFLTRQANYVLEDVSVVLMRQNIHVPNAVAADGTLAMLPHIHGTDGFFCAVMTKTN